MANQYREIDEKTWPRSTHCAVFRNCVEPAFCVTFEQVEAELKKIFDKATAEGKTEITLVSKDFFDQMKVKPKYRDCIPMCCKVMKDNFRAETDEVLYHTKSWQSHTLKIKYKLPR